MEKWLTSPELATTEAFAEVGASVVLADRRRDDWQGGRGPARRRHLWAALLETTDDEFERVMNVNLRGVWKCMKGELRQMLAQGSGAIVNCSRDVNQ